MAKEPIKFSNENSIITKTPEVSYAIELSDWNRIKDHVQKLQEPQRWGSVFGGGCIGVSGSALVQFIYNITQNSCFVWHKDVMLWVCVVFLIIGILGFILDWDHNRSRTYSIEVIINDIKEIEGKYPISVQDVESKATNLN